MKQKLSNLEAYYKEYCEKYHIVFSIPFEELNDEEMEALELSEGFRKFLIRGMWTKALKITILYVIVPAAILFGIYLKHS